MKISKNNSIFSMSPKNKAVLQVANDSHLTFETCDCFSDQISCESQGIDELDFSKVNPATGPVYIDGAEPGDSLAVSIKAIRLNSPGVVVSIKGAGSLPHKIEGKTSLCEFDSKSFNFQGVKLPLNPMIGVIGVAPAKDEISCGLPGDHGGNMDTTAIREGSVLYLPVFVKGALFALGDLHAAMGDGEVGVSALEASGEVDLNLRVNKELKIPCPLIKNPQEMAFLASAESLDEAMSKSIDYMHDFLMQNTELEADHALQLMSLCGEARVSQFVNPLKTARFAMPITVLKKFGVSWAF